MNWAPIAAILAFALLPLAVRWPVVMSLGIYAFLIPFDTILLTGDTGRIHVHFTWFVGAAAGALLLATGLMERGFLRPPRVALWLMLFIFWAGMSSLWAINTEAAVFRLPMVGGLLVLYLVGVSLQATEKELATIAWLAILGGCVAAGYSLYQFSHGEWWVPPEGVPNQLAGRGSLSAGDRLTNPNTLGASLLLPLSLALGALLSSRSWRGRLALTAAIAVISAAIYTTMSRGTLIAVIVVLLVCLWRSRVKWPVLVPLAVMGAIVIAMPDLFFSRLGEAFEDRGTGRVDIWNAGLLALRHHAISGVGLDCFPEAYNQYAYTSLNFVGFSRGPHNIYLGTWVELGSVGLVLLLGTIRGHFLLATKAYQAEADESSRLRLASYEAPCWGLLASGCFMDLLWEEYFWLAWMLLAMGVRARLARRATVPRDTRCHARGLTHVLGIGDLSC